MQELDKVKDRIRKLLNVAKDDAATQGEVENAVRFARSLLNKHHLDESDLIEEPADQYQEIERAPKSRGYVYVGKRMHYWESRLAAWASKLCGVGCYQDHGQHIIRTRAGIALRGKDDKVASGCRLCFYGIDEDVHIACELYDEMRETIIAMARLKWGGAFRGDGGAYAEGFVLGMMALIEEEDKQEKLHTAGDSTAMILVERRTDLIERKRDVAKEWLASECGIKLRKGRGRTGANGSSGAFDDGRSDGRKQTVNRQRRPKLA